MKSVNAMVTTRRRFLQAAPVATTLVTRARAMAGDRIRIGIAGVGGRGNALMKSLLAMQGDNVEVAAICDVDATRLAKAQEFLKKQGLGQAAAVGDLRRMLDDKSIDAVIHATPTHWHALGGIWTMQAGKDAYVEKPLALTPWEGHRLVEAARKYKRLLQHGTQCRSSPEILEAMTLLRDGVIGDLHAMRGMGHKYRPGIGRLNPETPPSTLNYDLWRGPSPMKPYSANQIHYNWHWFWDTGNGDLGNLAVHGLDVMRMALKTVSGITELPDRVQSMGGNFVFEDAKETPNYQTSVFRFSGRKLMLEYSIRNGYSNSEGGMGESIPFTMGDKRDSHALIVYGSEGYMLLPDYTSYYVHLGRDRKLVRKCIGSGPADANIPHLRNFLKAMRSRRTEDLAADGEEGRKSSALCHLANIAYRLGRTVSADPTTGDVQNDRDATSMETRRYRRGYEVTSGV